MVPTLKRPDSLAETLSSVLECDPPPGEIIVVDGDPQRSALSVVRALAPRATAPLVHLPSSPGLTRQRNIGLRAAAGDVVVFADDDVIFGRHVFAVLATGYLDDSIVGATVRITGDDARRVGGGASTIRRWLLRGVSAGGFTSYGYPSYWFDLDAPHDIEFMVGCFMSARRRSALEVLFDEELVGYALGEDEDFSYRLSRRGRIRYLPEASVHHKRTGFASQDRRALSRCVVINRAYLFRKNFEQRLPARMQFAVFLLVLFVHRGANLDWQGVRGLLEGTAAVLGRNGREKAPEVSL